MIRIVLAFSSAVFLILSFPAFDLEFFSWIALVPFLLAIKEGTLKATFGLSYLTGFCFFLGVFFWVTHTKGVTAVHYSALGLYLGFYFVLFGVFFQLIKQKTRFPSIIACPALFVAIEYLRTNAGFAAQPMNLLGYTQHQNLGIIQMASFTGVYGVSFVIVLVNAAIYDLIDCLAESRKKGKPVELKAPSVFRCVVVLAAVFILWGAGYLSLPSALSGESLSVAVIQGNIPPEVKWKPEYREQILSKYEDLSKEASKLKPHLIVWPEASTPGFVLKDMRLYNRMTAVVRKLNTYVVVGSAEYPKFSKTHSRERKSGNTALFFSPDGKVVGQYLKIYLIPFSEYIPYEGIIRWPEFIAGPSTNSHLAGTEPVLFGIDKTKFGTLICSEIIYPDLSRRMVKKGAGFLVNISNEGWFGKSAFSYQAISISALRAVENRVNVVRATNTGISSFIDPYGRVIARLSKGGEELFIEGTLTLEIVLLPPGTFYSKYGDILAYGCIAFSLGLVVWAFIKRKPTTSFA